MLNWGLKAFSYHWVFLSAPKSSLAKSNSSPLSTPNPISLFPLSVAADIHIQLASENPLKQLRILDMAYSPCPLGLSINPADGSNPRKWILKLKGRAKTIYTPVIASIWAHMSASMESGEWFWLLSCHSACQGLCLPALQRGWKSVLVWMFCLKMPEPLSFSLSLPPHHSETFLIAFLIWESKVSLHKMRSNQWIWVITKASLASFWHRGGRNRGKGRKGRLLGSCPNFLKIISFSNYPDIICVCALARVP